MGKMDTPRRYYERVVCYQDVDVSVYVIGQNPSGGGYGSIDCGYFDSLFLWLFTMGVKGMVIIVMHRGFVIEETPDGCFFCDDKGYEYQSCDIDIAKAFIDELIKEEELGNE
jgi:hypothetical protein